MYVKHGTALVDVILLSICIAQSLWCPRDSCEYIRRRALDCALNEMNTECDTLVSVACLCSLFGLL